MLKGKEFGKAIGDAIDLKLKGGHVKTKAAIARHFNMKPPSLIDWVKKGSVAKDKLPELWRYFSDVAGPKHWGMEPGEWPAELSTANDSSLPSNAVISKKRPPTKREQRIDAITALLHTVDMDGLAVILERAKDAVRDYPLAKETRK